LLKGPSPFLGELSIAQNLVLFCDLGLNLGHLLIMKSLVSFSLLLGSKCCFLPFLRLLGVFFALSAGVRWPIMALEWSAMTILAREIHDMFTLHFRVVDDLVAFGRTNMDATLELCSAIK
jgi:hypothetical protein